MRTRPRSCAFLGLVFVGLVICVALVAVLALIDVRDGLSPLELAYLQVMLSSREDELNRAAGTSADEVAFVVNPGDTAASIGQNLESQGFISDAELFRLYVRYNGLDAELEAGRYFLSASQTILEIAQALTDSNVDSITVRIGEGSRREEIAENSIDTNTLLTFTGQDFLDATGPGLQIPLEFADYVGLPDDTSLEGFLYPETYSLPPDADAADLRDMALDTFRERVDSSLQAAAVQQGRTLYEVVTLASIIWREARRVDELPLIAGVYLNRLEIGMTLDADPTVQYPLGANGNWWPQITADNYYNVQSPYNTYLNAGLPPGPIANPPLSAIQAVIYPEASDYFYFRADCQQSGYHVFARTFEEHVANGNCP